MEQRPPHGAGDGANVSFPLGKVVGEGGAEVLHQGNLLIFVNALLWPNFRSLLRSRKSNTNRMG